MAIETVDAPVRPAAPSGRVVGVATASSAAAALLVALVAVSVQAGFLLEPMAAGAAVGFSAAIAIIDARTMRIPNALVAPMAAAIAVLLLVAAAVSGEWQRIGLAAAGAALLGGLHLLLMLRGGGAGDMKLAAVIGLHLGYYHLYLLPVAMLVAYALGALLAVLQLARGRGRRARLAFGPFLGIGYLTTLGYALIVGL